MVQSGNGLHELGFHVGRHPDLPAVSDEINLNFGAVQRRLALNDNFPVHEFARNAGHAWLSQWQSRLCSYRSTVSGRLETAVLRGANLRAASSR